MAVAKGAGSGCRKQGGGNRAVQRIRSLIEATVTGLGYESVDVELASSGLLRVYIDRLVPEGVDVDTLEPVGIADCEKVSHQLGHVLLVEDFDYDRLEVSTPGLDRPLRTPAHFQRFAGEEVRIKLRASFQGQRRYSGYLTVEDDGRFGLELTEAEPAVVPAQAGRGKQGGARKRKTMAGKASRRTGEKLVFALDELEQARLVPKFDFRRQA